MRRTSQGNTMRYPSDESRRSVIVRATIVLACVLALLSFTTPDVHAQCRPLTSETCVDSVAVTTDFSFSQFSPYWTIVAVIPYLYDDKDIALYSSCGSGTILATSTGTSGTDFIVGDFNHNTVGTYYPQISYGSQTDSYVVEWIAGGDILPISNATLINVAGRSTPCSMVSILDVFLEQGVEYRIVYDNSLALDWLLSLFRNPSDQTFWAGRHESEWELGANTSPFIYVPPATDWYGVVVVPDGDIGYVESVDITFEKLHDCIPLDPGVCNNAPLYSVVGGPATDYTITPTSSSWVAMAVASHPTDYKLLALYTECDKNGTQLAHSFDQNSGPGTTEFIVGDFNHASPYTVYPVISNGDVSLDYTFQWDQGPGYFLTGAPGISGEINTTTTGCNLVDVYDLSLSVGTQYRLRFQESGDADIHVALFQNPGTTEYWAGRLTSMWELSDPTDSFVFTSPMNDVYGVVVFGNAIDGSGTYTLELEPYNDCTLIPSETCINLMNYPADLSFDADGYWAAVGVTPSEGDDKDINVFTECDGEGTHLAGSGYISGADFVVGDFNHNAAGTYYARVTYGVPDVMYSFDSDRGNSPADDILPLDTVVEGELGDLRTECHQLKIWDVFLSAGETYQIGLTRSGSADIWVALFHNPGTGDYWVGREGSVWETPAHTTFDYTPPTSDWYGIIAFANVRETWGTYTIRVSPTSVGTGVDPEKIVPEKFALYQNAPNPFNPSTIIRYDVPAGGANVSLRIFDVNGRLVKTLVSESLSPGEKSVSWHGDDNSGNRVASGVYFYSIETPGFRETRKLVLMK